MLTFMNVNTCSNYNINILTTDSENGQAGCAIGQLKFVY